MRGFSDAALKLVVPMRFVRFIPLAFVAGQHGFMLFAPYLAFCLTLIHMMRNLKRRRRNAMAPTGMPT